MGGISEEGAKALLELHAHELAGPLRQHGDDALEEAEAVGGRTTPSDPKYNVASAWYKAAGLVSGAS
jgi:hypothetical protein